MIINEQGVIVFTYSVIRYTGRLSYIYSTLVTPIETLEIPHLTMFGNGDDPIPIENRMKY